MRLSPHDKSVGGRVRRFRTWLGGIRRAAKVYREAISDAKRHVKFGGLYEDRVVPGMVGAKAERQLIKDFHRVEKGLALPSPKRPFGGRVEARLSELLHEGPRNSPAWAAAQATSALAALKEWNEDGILCDVIAPHHADTLGLVEEHACGNLLERELLSRRSVRNFTGDIPEESAIRRAVEVASTTPSVCNRQGWRAHYFVGEAAQGVLTLQNGNAGFRASVPAVFIVTADLEMFSGPSERNQRWIDGGLFAMNLALALQAQGLSTCFLNWSMPTEVSKKLRQIASIPESEDIVTLLALGKATPEARVARSPRRAVEVVLRVHGGTLA